jgi:hypothetical protein
MAAGERPAPLILVVQPRVEEAEALFGSYAAVVAAGRGLLAAELSNRLGAAGAAVTPLPELPADGVSPFHWGGWFAPAARAALDGAQANGRVVDAIGYAGPGSLALAGDALLEELISPIAGEVVANNRFSADAFVIAGGLDSAVNTLAGCPADNAAVRHLEDAGLASRDLAWQPWSRFDVDTPLDLALLRLAARLPGSREVDQRIAGFLEMATLPGGRGLEVPKAEPIGAVLRDRGAQLVVAGRIPAAAIAYLETEAACRVRWFVEERGMRSAPDAAPRSLLADWVGRLGPADLIGELSRLGDALVLDSRVLMAGLAGSARATDWPPAEERFASDFLEASAVATPWLKELTEAAANASIPVQLGGHSLVSDGLRILVDAAWLGR